ERRPCLVLTNGTDPVLKRLHQIETLRAAPHPVSFRVSIDYPDPARHAARRGARSFDKSWRSWQERQRRGSKVSRARQAERGEDAAAVGAAFGARVAAHGLPADMTVVSSPDWLGPHSHAAVPDVTAHCMTTYQTENSRRRFMCA